MPPARGIFHLKTKVEEVKVGGGKKVIKIVRLKVSAPYF